jgi:hypothetical protein
LLLHDDGDTIRQDAASGAIIDELEDLPAARRREVTT